MISVLSILHAGAALPDQRPTTMSRELLSCSPGIVSLTGGGGKTSLMYSLGAGLAKGGGDRPGARVLLTTTTRIKRPTQEQCSYNIECDSIEDIPPARQPGFFTAARPAPAGRNPEYLWGFSGDEINELMRRSVADWIIVEADGSAGRPLKAPSAKEPVIPSDSNIVIAVAGLSGIGKLFTDSWVFRPEPFTGLTGLKPGETLSPEAVAAIFRHPEGLFKGSPRDALRFAFFNQADIPGGMAYGARLARAVLSPPLFPVCRVYAGSARLPAAPCREFVLCETENHGLR